jgi:general secretion pathway protein J
MRLRRQRGFTLIELLIAITLVAAISTGMLMAMRTGLITLEKVDGRLQENRRVMAIQQMLIRQIASVMPSLGDCGTARAPMFAGTDQYLRFVSSYSLNEGARGYPQLVEYQIAPDPQGGLQLLENEHPFLSPSSSSLFCGPFQGNPQTFQVAHGLAAARFSYRDPLIPGEMRWLPLWNRLNLPAAVRLEMFPLHVEPGRLTLQSVNVPMRIHRDVAAEYDGL